MEAEISLVAVVARRAEGEIGAHWSAPPVEVWRILYATPWRTTAPIATCIVVRRIGGVRRRAWVKVLDIALRVVA